MGALLSKSSMPIVKWVAEVMGWLMNGIYKIGIHNLGLCIILFTIIIYAFMIPLQIKQQKFSKMNAVMSPELQKISKKYRGKKDQASQMKMQEETMAVYEKYGVSPTGSCLQLFIQMPIFFALYQVIINIPGYIGEIKAIFDKAVVSITSVDGYADVLTQFIKDEGLRTYTWKADDVTTNRIIDVLYNLSPTQWKHLGEISDFSGFSDVLSNTANTIRPMQNFLGLNIADTPLALIKSGWNSHSYLLILAAVLIPVLSWLTQMLNIKLMPTAATTQDGGANDQMNATMKSMNTFMPLFSAFICFSFPVGIGIYWIAGAVVRSVQQFFLNKHFEKINLEDIIKKNQEKAKKKREKMGITENQISNAARMNTRQVTASSKSSVKTTAEKELELEKANALKANAKPESMAAKANLVREFNERNNKKN